MKKPKQAADSIFKSEKGSIFFYILLGVVLFGTLAFTVSRGMRGKTTSAMTDRQIQLAATEIINYAQELEHAVNRLLLRGCSETEISFEKSPFDGSDSGYVNTNSPNDFSCHIFHPSGGKITYKPPSTENWLDSSLSSEEYYGEWFFTSAFCVSGVGDGATSSCWNDSIDNEELIVFLPYISREICDRINTDVNISSPPVNAGSNDYHNHSFKGVFNGKTSSKFMHDNVSKKNVVCIDGGIKPGYHLQYVLIAR